MTLNQKQLKNLVELAATAGRLNELNRLEGYVPSAIISRRKSLLKKQLRELVGKEEKKEEQQTVKISINVPSVEETKVEPKEKSLLSTLKELLSGKPEKKDDDDDNIVVILESLLPKAYEKAVIGKVVTEI
jgi:hypothetical protein